LSAAVGLLASSLLFPSSSSLSANDDERGERRSFSARLEGFSEVPTISSPGEGSFRAHLSSDGLSLHYVESYSGLSAHVTQSHIHFGQRHTAGAIMVWLCQTATNIDPTGLSPQCVNEGTVEGDITAANIVKAGSQGIDVGEFEEFVRALRNDSGYANVHTTAFPGGEIRGQIR
jgi:hypothetical protein